MISEDYLNAEADNLFRKLFYMKVSNDTIGSDCVTLSNRITISYAMKFLRNCYKIWIEIYKNRTNNRYRLAVYKMGSYVSTETRGSYGDSMIGVHTYYDSYEEACEAGIIKSCKYIIDKYETYKTII